MMWISVLLAACRETAPVTEIDAAQLGAPANARPAPDASRPDAALPDASSVDAATGIAACGPAPESCQQAECLSNVENFTSANCFLPCNIVCNCRPSSKSWERWSCDFYVCDAGIPRGADAGP